MSDAIRVNIYIDGLNLYYGCLQGTPYRWLNVATLCDHLLEPVFPSYIVNRIRYFTASVHDPPDRPGGRARQQVYLRALETIPNLIIERGQFKTNVRTYPVADLDGAPTGDFARVIRHEEKGSDVNLASYLLIDAMDGCYDVALVVSNDTDLLRPIALVRDRFAVAVGIAGPVYFKNRHPMADLENVADFTAHITKKNKSCLRASQFPEFLEGTTISRPEKWAPSS